MSDEPAQHAPPASQAPPIHEAAARRDWPAYYERIEGKPPRETTRLAIEKFSEAGETGLAVDLGCGSGHDCAFLLERGWRVLATDASEVGLDILRNRPACAGAIAAGRLETAQAEFGGFELPPCDLVNASFSLPFCPPELFGGVWEQVVAAICPGGRFAGQLFGDRDGWAQLADRSHQSRDEALALLEGFILERFEEEDRPGKTALDHPKHWHIFHIVARKR